ncbi:MAG: CBS domain-containing protein [Myxococcota bacterium]
MKVRELMTPDPVCCTPDTPLALVAQLMEENGWNGLPIVDSLENRALVGMITRRELGEHSHDPALDGDTPGGEVMTTDVPFCSPDDDVETVEETMEVCQVQRVPVVDEAGRCIGVVSRADVSVGGAMTS